MKNLLKKYPSLLYLLWFIPTLGGYFIANHIDLGERILVHSAIDDMIPFISFFSIPYALWYLYVPFMIIIVALSGDREASKKQAFAMFVGMAIGDVFFFFLPTEFPFRPEVIPPITNLDTFITNVIFMSDNPYNACPSLHVFEACILHLTVFRRSKYAEGHSLNRVFSLLFVIIVTAGTMFIKQHSVIDAVCGVALAVFMYNLTYHIIPWFEKAVTEWRKNKN